MINRTLFLTLIFCSVINAVPAQPPFLGADSVDVVVKEVAQIPESSQSFTVSSELFFDFFKKPQAFDQISQCECTQIKECSKLLTEHCQTLSQAKQIRKTSIATFKLSFPEEKLECAIKLMARKIGSQFFTTFTIFVPQKNDPEIAHALINFCNAAIPRLSFMQKHSGKVYSGVLVACVGLGMRWYYSPKQKLKRTEASIKNGLLAASSPEAMARRARMIEAANAKAKEEEAAKLAKLRPKYSSFIEVKKITTAQVSGAEAEACFCGDDFSEGEQQWSTLNCTCKNALFHEICILGIMETQPISAAAQEYRPGDGREYRVEITRTTCPICNQ